jgi:class 3 adenylate cyclase
VDPDIRYARNGSVAIAYQVVGDADRDLVLVPDFVSNLVYAWESAYWREFYERLARSFRVILFDKRGTGLSDRGGAEFAALETRMDDLRAVLEAAGSETALVFGSHEGGQMAALYAATYPDRTDALALFQFAPSLRPELTDWNRWRDTLKQWGTQLFADQLLAEICPTLLRTESDRLWFANWLRVGATPEIGYALNETYSHSDVRGVLPTIRVPTVLLTRGDIAIDELGDAPALIPNARHVRLGGDDAWGAFLSPEIVDELEQLADEAGVSSAGESVLATILFTDIVGSSELAAELGDRAWAQRIEGHHAVVRDQLRRFRGTEVDTAGDGFFATFDGPARAIRCGVAIRDALSDIDLDIRAGVHTGECAVVGGKPSGIAVSTGARVASKAGAGEVLVSQTVKDLVAGSGIALTDRGAHELKGVPGEWRLYAVDDV